MTLAEAKRIAGTLGIPSKMPGYSYGLDAWRCKRGSQLSKVKGSVCEGCFAKHNFYQWRPARVARLRRQAGIRRARWADAIVRLINHYSKDEPFFRFHDSGDLQGVWHLAKICEVALRVPRVRFWLPTREVEMVAEYLESGGTIPPNLVVRISAEMIDEKPIGLPRVLRCLPTSTVHTAPLRPVRIGRSRKRSIECKSYTRVGGNVCGPCRSCWDPRVKNVSYLRHR